MLWLKVGLMTMEPLAEGMVVEPLGKKVGFILPYTKPVSPVTRQVSVADSPALMVAGVTENSAIVVGGNSARVQDFRLSPF